MVWWSLCLVLLCFCGSFASDEIHDEAREKFARIREKHKATQEQVSEKLANSRDAAHNKLQEMHDEKLAAIAAQQKVKEKMNSPIEKKRQKQKMKNMRAAERRKEKLKKAGKGYFSQRGEL